MASNGKTANHGTDAEYTLRRPSLPLRIQIMPAVYPGRVQAARIKRRSLEAASPTVNKTTPQSMLLTSDAAQKPTSFKIRRSAAMRTRGKASPKSIR